MKKIIYSLVIMIAAGSLFTSCVENTEPQGIRDLREAKADYLYSLSKLREADAELVKAQAAYQTAQITVVEAEAALKQALANIAQALADAAQIGVEYLDAELQMKLEADKAAAEIAAVEAQENLAKQQAQLEKALRKIAAESIGLTGDEQYAIAQKTLALNTAQGNYNTKFNEYNEAAENLWEAEYNVAAGVKDYETAESFKDSIAALQADIVDIEAEIAGYEDLKENPSAVKDTLDAIDAQIEEIDKAIFLIDNEKTLYEQTPGFKEAQTEFRDRIDTFVEDSLQGAGSFKFFDINEDGNEVPFVYDLTDGKQLDKKFVAYLNEFVWPTDEENYYTGFNGYWGEGDVIKVGSYSQTELEKAVAYVDKIVEGLNRELVVIDNITDSTDIETLKKAAHVADSTYKADRKILEIGFEKSVFMKGVADSLAKLAADTAAAKDKYTDAAEELKTKEDDVKTKKSDQIAAVRTVAAAFESAVKDMAAAVVDFKGEEVDSAAFIKAIQTFGKAQVAFLGAEDSLTYTTYDPYTRDPKTSKDAFSALNPKFFVHEAGHPVYNEDFLDVVKKVFGESATLSSTKKALIAGAAEINPLKGATDSVAVLKEKNQTVKAAVEAYTAAEKEKVTLENKVNTLKVAFEGKLTDYNTYKSTSTDKAKTEYTKVYNKFWGYYESAPQPDEIYKPYEFTWTDKTFFEPENCVVFNVATNRIIANSQLIVALNGVDVDPDDPTPYGWNIEEGTFKDVNESKIFNHDGTLTEFASAILAAQVAEEAGEYVSNKARLEKINAQVAQIKADVKAAIAEYEAATEGQKDVLARLCGVDEDGNPLFQIYELKYYLGLYQNYIVEGEWVFGGYLLEWAEELAPEYPALVELQQTERQILNTKRNNLWVYRNTLDNIYTNYFNTFENPEPIYYGNVEAIIRALNDAIKNCKTDIKNLKDEIAVWEKEVARCEAGYSPAKAKVDGLKAILEIKKAALEQAEEALARAQKEYDEVIAKYGVNRRAE